MSLKNTLPTPFYLYVTDNHIHYSAKHVFETDDRLFLIESNKEVSQDDIVLVDDVCYDIANNDFYVMVVLNKKSMTISASYGQFSYCHSLHYYISHDGLFINLSLRSLLNDIKIRPTLDCNSASKFIVNGFVRESDTLIEQIKKVPPLRTAVFNNNSVELINSKYTDRPPLYGYVDNLKLSLPSKDKHIILPLSGGFDSTLLSYIMKDYNIHAFSVGVNDNYGELVNASNTAKILGFDHHKIFASHEWIKSFPNIVNLMEGDTFDIGTFLCYAMVNEIKDSNIDGVLVTGDGADQVLNKNFYKEDISLDPVGCRLDDGFLNRQPKHFLYYLIVNKMEWLLHEYGIPYVAPYMSKEFANYAKTVIHTYRKEEYKKFVKSYVPTAISKSLVKRGGLIHESYFVNKHVVDSFIQALNNPKYECIYKPDTDNLRSLIYRMYIAIFNYLFIENKPLTNFDEIVEAL